MSKKLKSLKPIIKLLEEAEKEMEDFLEDIGKLGFMKQRNRKKDENVNETTKKNTP